MIDTHCHLDAAEFDADRAALHAEARAAGVRFMVVPAVMAGNFHAVKACCAHHEGCLPAYGIHPLYASTLQAGDLERLRTWLAAEEAVALGEIGLDGSIDPAGQEALFEAQLRLAETFALPVLLHVRRAVDRVLWHLRRHRLPGGIAHAFNGSRQQAEAFIRKGFCLGFGGSMSFPGSTRIRKLAVELPLESLVLETDAPDIPPAWLGGGRNTPAQLPRIAAVLAELRGETLSGIAAATTRNAERMLGFPYHKRCGGLTQQP